MKNCLTFWNSNIIMNLWNSESEVIRCLHERDGQKQKTRNQTISKLDLMTKPQRDSMNIARPIRLHGQKQYDREYTCFWHQNKNIGPLLYLGGRTVNRYSPDPCGSGVNLFYYTPRKRSTMIFCRGYFMPDLRRKTRLYSIWSNMKERCNNPNAAGYKNYGGRGITVCPEWEIDFLAFEEWAYSHGYREYLTIDRIDNDKGYYPENCRWSTRMEQAQNRRTPIIPKFKINGTVKTAEEWSKIAGISRKCFYRRYRSGWRGAELLSPLQVSHSTRGKTDDGGITSPPERNQEEDL